MAKYTGTSAANRYTGTAYADTIYGYGGADILEGRGGNDIINGGSGNDQVTGGSGNDRLTGGLGNDTFMFGSGGGLDVITDFRAGDIVRVSDYTRALSITQVGSDVVMTFSAGDKITFLGSTLATVSAGLQFGTSTSGGGGTTTTAGMTVMGTAAYDTLNGTAGNDTIYGLAGFDIIKGGGGNDRIYGGLGGDWLYGGAGTDVFVYNSAAEAPLGFAPDEIDRIYDFQAGEKIDLSGIDANSLVAGNQTFFFAGYAGVEDPLLGHSVGALYIRTEYGTAEIIGFTNGDDIPDVLILVSLGAGQTAPTASSLIF